MTTTTANIAAKFNVLEAAVIRVEEWANVMFCVVKGIGARFVSKKLKVEEIKMETIETEKRTSASGMIEWRMGRKFQENGKIWVTVAVEQTGEEWNEGVADDEFIWAVTGEFVRMAD
jgi:hypothetical protein